MARTKMIARIVQDQRHQAARQETRARAKPAAAVTPSSYKNGCKKENNISSRT